MTIGIYKLFWIEEPNNLYIGQSQDIEKRYRKHCNDLIQCKHFNYKVSSMYNKYGTIPMYEVIDENTIDRLNYLEELWIGVHNSIASGLNITNGGSVGYGTTAAYSKYSKIQILQVFRLLSNTRKQYKEISKASGVHTSTIKSIFKGESHLWLKDRYPRHYANMLSRKRLVTLVSPEGVEVSATNLAEISRNYGLCANNLNNLVNGKRHSCNGWVLKGSDEEIYFTNGARTVLVTNFTQFAEDNDLDRRCLSKLKLGKQKVHKGWRLLQ